MSILAVIASYRTYMKIKESEKRKSCELYRSIVFIIISLKLKHLTNRATIFKKKKKTHFLAGALFSAETFVQMVVQNKSSFLPGNHIIILKNSESAN